MKYFCSILLFFMVCSPLFSQNKERFRATDESLRRYEFPEWFRDAKFGIWAHWGPQAVPGEGDWYAKRMYEQGKRGYKVHIEKYGHPSEFGYKDILPLWKAEKWNPKELMKLFKRVGARYFVSMGIHHDNFALWDSPTHRWNSVNIGPCRDVVGEWQRAAKKEGLKFGVSEHLAASFNWFQTAHQSDCAGDKAGIPYDGNDPRYQDLYHDKSVHGDNGWYTSDPKRQRIWLQRITELIDLYHPDLLYSDGRLPFGDIGREMLAYYYNQDFARNKSSQVVYTAKKEPNDGRFAMDFERGVAKEISPYPWQTDTSIGDWFYRAENKGYSTSKEIIQMLIDVVSKNGNLLLNVVQTPAGDIEQDVLSILEEIASWMEINGSSIWETRPWRLYGEGPSMQIEMVPDLYKAGGVKDIRRYLEGDLRFTQKEGKLYVFSMEKVQGDLLVRSLGKDSITYRSVKRITLLGSFKRINFDQQNEFLRIEQPVDVPAQPVLVYCVEFR